MHRVGKHAYTHAQGLRMEPPREDGRRCLHPSEMAARGMSQNERGRWQLDAAVEGARKRFGSAQRSPQRGAQHEHDRGAA